MRVRALNSLLSYYATYNLIAFFSLMPGLIHPAIPALFLAGQYELGTILTGFDTATDGGARMDAQGIR
jgi:hypothetical protein